MAAMFVDGLGQNEQSLERGPSIHASYQVTLHLAEGFQRRRLKYEKLMDDGRQVMGKAQNPLPEADASEAEVCEEQTETKVRKFLD